MRDRAAVRTSVSRTPSNRVSGSARCSWWSGFSDMNRALPPVGPATILAHVGYEVGVMPWYETEPPRIHGVLVDAVTGAIVGQLDRPWDREVDPFPW